MRGNFGSALSSTAFCGHLLVLTSTEVKVVEADAERCCRWWQERRWCHNATSSANTSTTPQRPSESSRATVTRLGSLHLGHLGGLFIALAVTLTTTTAVSVAQWFWCRRRHRHAPGERRNKPSTGNRLPLSQLRNTVTVKFRLK